jgi:hypothetical protein
MQNEIPLENFRSLFYQLDYINCILEKTIETQTINAESQITEKCEELNNNRERNLNIHSKVINMENILKIEEFFSFNYEKILNLLTKLNSIGENLEDLKPNINFALDKIYLDDNIVCDENLLRKNLTNSCTLIENLIEDHNEERILCIEIKSNYMKLKTLIEGQKKKFLKTKVLLEKFKKDSINNNVNTREYTINKKNL